MNAVLRKVLPVLLICGYAAQAAAAEGMARIITDVGKPVQCIAPLEIYQIDGKLVKKNAMGFDLEPGRHTMVGTAQIDARNCPTMRISSIDVPPLDYEFEAGHTYYVGLEHKSGNQQQWRFVVWRVIEPKD